ncbi:MAG TPA: hypothetical protein PKO22_10945, partial [Treponemataceae bacterium]|nr:hypothetical protein [Treponemataceae bacterium]
MARDPDGMSARDNSAKKEDATRRDERQAPTLVEGRHASRIAGNHPVPLFYFRATRTIVRAFSLYGEKSKS